VPEPTIPVAGINLSKGGITVIPGLYTFTVSWRVEEKTGRFSFTKKIDLNAIAMVANPHLEWVGAAHTGDKSPFGGLINYGGDTKAKSGGMASETITFDLAALQQDPDAAHIMFAATNFGNPLELGQLAELRFQLTDPNGNQILPGGRRSIQGAASAALAVRVDVNAGTFVEVNDAMNVGGSERVWRQLADASTAVLRRN
jgi:hypothetical protein